MVMLQMAEKSTKLKRRALLMNQGEAPTTTTTLNRPEPSHEPQPLPGDVFERMRMDPEIHQFRQRLVIGSIVVGVIVLLLVGLFLFQSSKEQEAKETFVAANGGEATFSDVTKKGNPEGAGISMVTPVETQPPVNPGSLVFRPLGSNELKTAQSQPAVEVVNLAKLADAEEALRKFLQATDWKQRVLLVRNKLRAAPLMDIYYSNNADGPMAFDSIIEGVEVSPEFAKFVVVFQGGLRRTAIVEHTNVGPRVDWESFVGAGEMAWSAFLEAKTATPKLFRVLVSPAGHFENQFGDPSVLKCYSLRNISEPGAKVVYGYVDKTSALAKELDYYLQQSGDETVPMILQLKFPMDATVDFQVWIQQFVQEGWGMK